MSLPRSPGSTQSGGISKADEEVEIDNLPRPPHPLEENDPVRTGQEVLKKNLQRLPLPYEGNIPASMAMDGLPKMLFTGETQLAGQLSRPLEGPLLSGAGLLGLTGCSISRQKLLNHGLSRPLHWDPKIQLPRPCRSKSSIPMGGRLRELVDNGWV